MGGARVGLAPKLEGAEGAADEGEGVRAGMSIADEEPACPEPPAPAAEVPAAEAPAVEVLP